LGSIIFCFSLRIREKKRENERYFWDLSHVKFPVNNSMERNFRERKETFLGGGFNVEGENRYAPLQFRGENNSKIYL
jgi:hypothetical protein